jgi:hypothetical protein
MSKEEQERVAKEIAENALNKMLELIREGHVPEHWDGIELRWYMGALIDHTNYDSYVKRRRIYLNDVLIDRHL